MLSKAIVPGFPMGYTAVVTSFTDDRYSPKPSQYIVRNRSSPSGISSSSIITTEAMSTTCFNKSSSQVILLCIHLFFLFCFVFSSLLQNFDRTKLTRSMASSLLRSTWAESILGYSSGLLRITNSMCLFLSIVARYVYIDLPPVSVYLAKAASRAIPPTLVFS